MSVKWSVVIPSDNLANLEAAVVSIRKAHPYLQGSDIIVVTRDLKPPNIPPILQGLTYVTDPDKFVFARRVNKGIQSCGEKDVVLVGDDVEVSTMDAFNVLAQDASLRLLAPSVRGRIGPWWQREGATHVEVPFLSFVCVYIPRAVYQIVGPLDEAFPGYGYEDTDYCMRARRAGLSCGVSGNVVVEHGVRLKSSFLEQHGAEIGALEMMAREAFIQKWRHRS